MRKINRLQIILLALLSIPIIIGSFFVQYRLFLILLIAIIGGIFFRGLELEDNNMREFELLQDADMH
jgi:hypothetical protein